MAHIPPSFAGDHPPSTNAADGASACGMFDIQTAAMNEVLNVSPAPNWMPKIRDSGTPSTTGPDDDPQGATA